MSWLNSADMNAEVHLSFQIKVFSGYTARNGTAEAYGSSVFSFFLRKFHTAFHSGCAN